APPSMPALDLLLKMQTTRTHMALVIDEYGGCDGLVSIEDVVEAIVGDIEDEHDEADTPAVEKTADGAFIADARASLEDLSTALGDDFAKFGEAEDVDTVGGLVTAKAGRVPGRGEIVGGIGDYEFEILDADPRRVKKVKIQRAAPPAKKSGARRKRAGAAPPSETVAGGGEGG
ncbi:MAG TPA: transporter associated domain-containing protein, partial [Roseiarcus sp.]|nr:transporter associated domain-containing protein [Roseiarcus sp.]